MVALIMALTVHEYAHAKSAELAGDDTAKFAGRVSLNPLDHLDPIGTLMMAFMAIGGMGIGWAKPVPVNPFRMRHPRWDNVKVSLWGPLSNLTFALGVGLLVRILPDAVVQEYRLLIVLVRVNLSLAMFNLIPIAPLDGSHILSGLLPADAARSYERFMGQYGMLLLLGLIFVGGDLLWAVIGPPMHFLFTLFTGWSLY